VIDIEDLREQVFALTYCMEGVGYDAISEMPSDEREWFVRRLDKQIKRENDEVKKAQAKNKGRRGSSRVGRKR
jgi:hypothetical protein